VIGVLVLLQGMAFLLFWKVFGLVIAVGIGRYSNFSGKMAKAFFSQDKTLMQLLQVGTNYLPILLALGSIISACGILMLAFPKQTVQILIALRVFKRF
jgi:hypothetical protein